jgi:putative selenate reductase
MKLGIIGKDGRRTVQPVDDEFEIFEVDSIISAIGEKVNETILGKNKITDKYFGTTLTNLENVFIGGDALRGPSTVVESIADGKKAAELILHNENIHKKPVEHFDKYFEKEKVEKEILLKKGSIEFQKNDQIKEAARCLECSFICNKCVDVCPNRANVAVKSISKFKNINQILHIDSLCNECGNCKTFCPYNGAPYKDKVTLFASEIEFNKSSNDGFYLQQNKIKNQKHLKIRFRSKVGNIVCKEGTIIHSSFEHTHYQEEFELFLAFVQDVCNNYSYLIYN